MALKMTSDPPDLELDQNIVDELNAVCDIQPKQVLERARQGLRPCLLLRSRRASDLPLKHEGLKAWFKRPTASPILDLLNSKFGGIPYDEGSDWAGFQFLGQINFAQAHADHLGFPTTGLLAIDRGPEFRVRWYPTPESARATPVQVPSVGRYECKMMFEPAWSMPATDAEFLALFEGFPQDALDVLVDWLPDTQLGTGEGHQLGGWPAAGLFDHYGFTPPDGLPEDLAAWTMILRLDFDAQAEFAWGSNVLYLIAPNQDVTRGDLGRAMVVAANY